MDFGMHAGGSVEGARTIPAEMGRAECVAETATKIDSAQLNVHAAVGLCGGP